MCKTWVKLLIQLKSAVAPLWPTVHCRCGGLLFSMSNWGSLIIFPLNSEFDNNEYRESLEENKDEIKKVQEHLTDVVANTPDPSRIPINRDDSVECSTYIREIKKCKWIKLNWNHMNNSTNDKSENSFFPPPHPKTLILIVHTTVFT